MIEGPGTSQRLQQIVGYSLCEKLRACGECASCKKIKKGFHPDWLSANADSKMEDIRDLLYRLRQRPFEGTKRCFTFFDFQEASPSIQNALLKTLEEPQGYWVIALGSTSRWCALETIRSRCLLYREQAQEETDLKPSELKVFESIRDIQELNLFSEMEAFLKDRQKSKTIFQNLLNHASKSRYPGHWARVAVPMEKALSELDRNLNPKIIWDRLWAQSFHSA